MTDVTQAVKNFDPNKFKSPFPSSIGPVPVNMQPPEAPGLYDKFSNAVGAFNSAATPVATGLFNGLENARNGVLQAGSGLGAYTGLWSEQAAAAAQQRLKANKMFEDAYPVGTPSRAAFDMASVVGEAAPYAAMSGGMMGGAGTVSRPIVSAAQTLLGGAGIGFLQNADTGMQRLQNTLVGGAMGAIPAAGIMASGSWDALKHPIQHGLSPLYNFAYNSNAGKFGGIAANALAAGSGTFINALKPPSYIGFGHQRYLDSLKQPGVAEVSHGAGIKALGVVPTAAVVIPQGNADILRAYGVTADQANAAAQQMIDKNNADANSLDPHYASSGMDVTAYDNLLRQQALQQQEQLRGQSSGDFNQGQPFLYSVKPAGN